jgi:signal peptidase I
MGSDAPPEEEHIPSLDIAHVDAPTGRTIPQWVTLREAGLLSGLPEPTLLRCVESGIVASDTVLSERLGMRFVVLDSNDLVKSGLLRPSEVSEEKLAAVFRGREQVDVFELEAPTSARPTETAPPVQEPAETPVAPEPPTEAVPAQTSRAPIDLGEMALPEWVTLREAAFITGLDEQSLQRHADSGLIATHSLGRRRGSGFLLVRSSDLERALRLDQEAPPAPPETETEAATAEAPPYFEPGEDDGELIAQVAPPPSPKRIRQVAPAPVLVAQPGEVARMTNPWLRWLRRAAVWATLAVSAATLVVVALPLAFGYHTAAVRTGDMEPAYHVGDVVIARTVGPRAVHPDDVVTFRDPVNPARLIIQRVRTVDDSGGSVHFTTKPDTGGSLIEWSVPVDGRVGVVTRRFGGFGHVLTFVQSRVGQVALIVTPLLALGLIVLGRTWRRPASA